MICLLSRRNGFIRLCSGILIVHLTARDLVFDLSTHFWVSTWKWALDFEWLVNYWSKQHLPSRLTPTPPYTHLAFHALHPYEKFPASQITRVSWGGKEGNQLRLKISVAAVTAWRKQAPQLLAEGQMEGPHGNKTSLWSEHTGAARETTGANWTAALSGASTPLHLALSRSII